MVKMVGVTKMPAADPPNQAIRWSLCRSSFNAIRLLSTILREARSFCILTWVIIVSLEMSRLSVIMNSTRFRVVVAWTSTRGRRRSLDFGDCWRRSVGL